MWADPDVSLEGEDKLRSRYNAENVAYYKASHDLGSVG